VTRLAACALAALLLTGCSPARVKGSQSAPRPVYTLSIVSGNDQSGKAVLQPITFNVGGGSVQSVPPSGSVALPLALVVLVIDAQGKPADGVYVQFVDPASLTSGPPDYGSTVMGLGTATSGDAVTFANATQPQPAVHGQAACSAQPYRIGTFPVSCSVVASSGTSNTVVFEVTGQ